MAGPKLNLPPFAALRAFVAAATHDRFRDAADSLGLTESAISHQLRRLEGYLRVSLFDRAGKRPQLTEAGRRYLAEIEPAMRQIHDATEALLPARGRRTVRLTLPPSLAATWLIPRLAGFEDEHADIDLQLVTTARVVDLMRDQIDLAIRHGRGGWPQVEETYLFAETAMPVCAPGYLAPVPGEPTAADIAGVRFLVNANTPDEWLEWSRARGFEPPAPGDLIIFDVMEQALQVAASGHGLAMGRRPLVDDWLADGRLIIPFGAAGPTGAGYYLCRARGVEPTVPVRRVADWLTRTAAQWRGADSK